MERSRTRIGIFGGSFSPFTNSHFAIAKAAYDKCWLDQVWLVPTYKYEGKESICHTHRLAMVDKMVDKLRASRDICWLTTSRIDIDNQFTQSYDTVTFAKNKYPHIDFFFICGLDSAKSIHSWENSDKLIESVPFIVCGREDYDKESGMWFDKYPHQYMERISPSVSSTQVRGMIKNKKIGWENLVHPEVARYIKNNNLYKEAQYV